MRTKIIAGNWKMNKTPNEGVALVNELKDLVKDAKCDVVVCPTAVCLPDVVRALDGTNVSVGAQNVHFEEKGAFTGELAGNMLKEVGVKYVIIGHSERRQYFGETDETVNKRTIAAINAGLTPIVCVGETLTQREQGIMEETVRLQTKIAYMGIEANDAANTVIAYEPVWAIGTGKTATADQANEVCEVIRNVIAKIYDKDAADAITIQYGGSMNAGNAAELLAKPDVDGGLIGGASLKAPDFAVIVDAATKG